MSLEDLLEPFSWSRYSKKMCERILRPINSGFFSDIDTKDRAMRCVVGRDGELDEANVVHLYLLVDLEDGIIVDAKFQVFGQSPLIAAADGACDLLVGKNHEQAKRLSADLIDKQLRDKAETPAFPEETKAHLNTVLSAIDDACLACEDIPLSPAYSSPVPRDLEHAEGEGHPDWERLSREQKIALIEEVISEEVRPYIELDEGGIEILDFLNDKELIISYKGACTSCFSAVGATLSTIQEIVRSKLHPEIVVVPNMDELHF